MKEIISLHLLVIDLIINWLVNNIYLQHMLYVRFKPTLFDKVSGDATNSTI